MGSTSVQNGRRGGEETFQKMTLGENQPTSLEHASTQWIGRIEDAVRDHVPMKSRVSPEQGEFRNRQVPMGICWNPVHSLLHIWAGGTLRGSEAPCVPACLGRELLERSSRSLCGFSGFPGVLCLGAMRGLQGGDTRCHVPLWTSPMAM